MDYSWSKFAQGQERAFDQTVSIVNVNMSKDGKTLDLTSAQLREYGAKDVACMDFLEDLSVLEMGANLIGPEGAKYLANSKCLINLTSLNLSYNRIKDDGAKYIAVSDNLLSLQNLILSDNNIGEEGAKMLAKFLPLFTHLVRVDLRLNYFKDEGKRLLREAQKLTNIKQLLLDKDEGFRVHD